VELWEAPENWAGPLDVSNVDELGTNISENKDSDWNEPLDVFEHRSESFKEK